MTKIKMTMTKNETTMTKIETAMTKNEMTMTKIEMCHTTFTQHLSQKRPFLKAIGYSVIVIKSSTFGIHHLIGLLFLAIV